MIIGFLQVQMYAGFFRIFFRCWTFLSLYCRFFSIDEQLACYCGFPRCRGVVNDIESEERAAKLYAPRSELIDWRGEWDR